MIIWLEDCDKILSTISDKTLSAIFLIKFYLEFMELKYDSNFMIYHLINLG